jgi:hypothetical protein
MMLYDLCQTGRQQKIGGAWLFCADTVCFLGGKGASVRKQLIRFFHILHVKPLAELAPAGAGAYNPLKERDFPAPKIGR